MKNRIIASTLLIVLLFLINSCDLLNPIIGSGKNEPTLSDNFTIAIERTDKSIQGQSQAIEISLQNNTLENYPIGSFDLLFAYDASALVFQSADPGQFLVDCGWEYFTYRYRGITTDSSAFGIISINALAETNNGPGNHPDCFNVGGNISNQLAVLNFLVTNDRAFECEFAPIKFLWDDCDDNTITNNTGEQLFLSNHIYNKIDTSRIDDSTDLADYYSSFPSFSGYNGSCDGVIVGGKPVPLRKIDFINGGVDINCADSIDTRGDLNLNGIAYEITDAVLYSNYFIYGSNVFTVNLDGQIAASDVNADGITLTVADLVYQIRVIVGDALPYPRNIVNEQKFINGTVTNDNGLISIDQTTQAAAAHIVVKGDITPTLLADNMTIISNFDGTNTNILIYSLENNNFSGEFVNIGTNEIVSLKMADVLGNQVIVNWVPTTYALEQNYPNPFNPTTRIPFSIPVNANVTLDIYNNNGQKITTLSGTFETGNHEFEWDASNYPSGAYSYTLRANNFVATKTMLKIG